MPKLVGFSEVDYSIEPRRGFELVEYDNEYIVWPRCEITGCEAGVCIGMSKSLCYPHGIEFKAFTEAEFEANRKARHGV
jgi:hypothetical protein